jgi:hypothetical protein
MTSDRVLRVLDDARAVGWEQLGVAEMSVADIPTTLEGLISERPELRRAAHAVLESAVVRQGFAYEAAFEVVGLLLDLLRAGAPRGRDLILDLIWEIANANSEALVHFDGHDLPVAKAARRRVVEAVDVLVDELRDRSSEARRDALEVIWSLAELAGWLIPLLEELERSEEDEALKAELSEAIAELRRS